jgi:hypothetical protein
VDTVPDALTDLAFSSCAAASWVRSLSLAKVRPLASERVLLSWT